MKLSAEELERIKESHKAKDLQEILKEEKDKKDDEDGFTDDQSDAQSDAKSDAQSDEGGDQNFISDMVDQHTLINNTSFHYIFEERLIKAVLPYSLRLFANLYHKDKKYV